MRTRIDDLRELEDEIFKDDYVPTIAPIIAENELLRRHKGLHFWTVLDEDRRALLNGVWPWHVACCFVAWQRFDGAAAGVASFRKWQGRIWRDQLRPGQKMTMAEAEFTLRNALEAGDIKAEAMHGDDVVEIPAGEWPRLKFEGNAQGEVIEFDRLQRKGKPRYEEPTLRSVDVMKLWHSLDGWAPDFDEVVDIDPNDIRVVPDPMLTIANSAAPAAEAPPRTDREERFAQFARQLKGRHTQNEFWDLLKVEFPGLRPRWLEALAAYKYFPDGLYRGNRGQQIKSK